jgi:hypothetical protein
VKSSRSKRRLRAALLVAVGCCFVASIPWYRPGGEDAAIWLGLPDWVTVALLCYVAAAVLNAAAWWLTEIPEGLDDDPERR